MEKQYQPISPDVKGLMGPTHRRSWRRVHRSVVALLGALLLLTSPQWSLAKVNPLVVIERQIHKANMLIVLDTSGSMTGVPGGVFTYKNEAGVDCDGGYNCRQAGVMGTCVISGKSCYGDDDCLRGTCSTTPSQYCNTDSDCRPSEKICSQTKGACSSDTDCPTLSGTCSSSGDSCATNDDCPTIGKCECGIITCTEIGKNCPATGTCKQDPERACTSDLVCPQHASGSCAQGGTPPSGCGDHSDCPSKQKCENTDESCRATVECPGMKKGRCSINGNTCTNDNQCNVNETCLFWTNSCVGPPNPCEKSFTTCELCPTNNKCVATTNTCVPHPNTCVDAPANSCIAASLSDMCGPSNNGVPGPIRMCRNSQTLCAKDNDCPSGDSCGPASSRMVVAKRAINSVITSSYEMVNFGFMTYWQSGYFPYYQITSSGTTGTITVFQSYEKIVAAGCWIGDAWGPKSPCVISGTTMTLRSTQNSRYSVNLGTTTAEAEQPYCGLECLVRGVDGSGVGNSSTGLYQGSYYEYDGAIGGNATASLIKQEYVGKTFVDSGVNYTYYQALTNYYNGGTPPPFQFSNCEQTNACGAECGGRWDTQLASFLDTQNDGDSAKAKANVLKIAQNLEPASYGGLLAYWSTPTGCMLKNDSTVASPNNSAYHYMHAVKSGDLSRGISADVIACRENYVLLITDGAANGPGDLDADGNSLCDVDACNGSDPTYASCQCRSVLATYHLRKDLGVKTFVIGFGGDANSGSAVKINDNMARAGGTDADSDGMAPYAFAAQNEEALNRSIQMAILDAVKGSYSTAPTSTSAGTQQATTVAEGKYALDSRMDFPEWKGHLLAYDLSGTTPVLAWDAYQKLAGMNWYDRKIYTWNGSTMVLIQVDAATRAITNKAALAAMGLGASADEAERIARWLLGDPAYGNRAILGAIINSTPLDVASPGDIPEPGGHAYFLQNQNRPHLIYVGASDGLLHAFFLENTTIGSTTFAAGTEAFAFLPPDKMAMVTSLYAQGGQKPIPSQHLFGLADSPKAKTLCVQNCTDAAAAVWKTVLIMPEGYGGNDTFMLDVSSPFTATGLAHPPVNVLWHTNYGSLKPIYDALLGNTISLPAFYFNKTDSMSDYRVIFTSGYPVNAAIPTQGRALISLSAATGAMQTTNIVGPKETCAQTYAALTDVATARDFASGQSNKLLAAYFGDTSGQLFRKVLGATPIPIQEFGCQHPLHYSPTVAQLDRDALNTTHSHEIFPVQVTNSNLDLDTKDYEPSKIVIWKDVANADKDGAILDVSTDTNWVTNGKITLTVGNDDEICGKTQMDVDGVVSCKESMPITARPTATPLGLLLRDASGFEIMTMWYAAASDGCTRGQTYLTIHRIKATGEVTQRLGLLAANEPVTSPVILGGRVYLFGSSGAIEITGLIPDSVTPGRAVPPSSSTGAFGRMSWTEIL